MELLKHASETADTMELIRVTDELYNKVVDPAFVKKHGDLASVLAVTIEELTEYSWKDFISEELYEDRLETYLERVSLDMTNFTSKEAEEKKEKTAGSDTKKVVVVDEKALARMYQYIQRNYGKRGSRRVRRKAGITSSAAASTATAASITRRVC